ncbi:MAG: ankyrin repeat domain-containing protein [Spirochaetales bacterium]|nr:ankyrin repeat domain-containing protein [Spirochaetales bacterium]
MNVAVLVGPEDAHLLVSVLGALRDVGLEGRGLKLSPAWRDENAARIETALGHSSHFVAILTQASADSAWLAFAAGWAQGKGRPLACYRPDPATRVPGFIGKERCHDELDALAMHLEAGKAEYLVRERRRLARSALLERGVSFHADAFAACASDGDVRAVGLFLDAGFPADSRDRSGVPVLCLAARSRHRSVVELLVDSGASVDLQAEDRGYTALCDAAHTGNADLAEYLLKRGADPNLRSKDGQTALVIAVGRNDPGLAELLLRYGADPDLKDKLGLSARKYAKLFHDPAVAALFADRD